MIGSKSQEKRISFTMVLMAVFIMGLSPALHAKEDNDPHMTGLPEITKQELEWQNKHMLRVKKVHVNRMGLDRINAARKQKGLEELSDAEAGLVEKGQEVEGTVGVTGPTATSSEAAPMVLPNSVNNSTLKYFPPIRSQGAIGSCGSFSGVYYAMTYMNALARDLDAKTGGDTYRFSPKWAYNMVNGGSDSGSWYYWAYDIGLKHGCATWADFPYDGNYRAWPLTENIWRNAVNYRFDKYGYVDNTNQAGGIDLVKQMLVNGYILNFPTYIYSWQWTTITDDPATSADDAYTGKRCVYYVNGSSGYHAMTVVGYNDDIWVDINKNGVVDAGEKGAFRIANSWGTGWEESGFCWMAYDALKNPSAVAGGPATGRITGWSPARAHWVTARPSYQPTMLAVFTLNHLTRNQLRMGLGISDITQSVPTTVWYPKMISGQGGAYAFDGTTTAVDGTFVFDFSDIVSSSAVEKRYYLEMNDSTAGNMAFIKSFRLIDVFNGGLVTDCVTVPKTCDAGKVYGDIDYAYYDGNTPPNAVLTATPLSGQAPLQVQFDGTTSYDPDGSIVTYTWNFGDGGTADGPTATHSYSQAGTYTGSLRVTDNQGASDSAAFTIQVLPDPSKLAFVGEMAISCVTSKGGTVVQAAVFIRNTEKLPVAGALVQGSWGGVLTGTSSKTTSADGTVFISSKKTTKKGLVSFTVNNVTAAGYTYDPKQNVQTTVSMTIP